ncbi:helix-turn-helix domain-containing protein [Rhodopirellula sallentina]|uniref:Transcriptional regulator, AraC family n=1 Tax=Rhodopirellula sallentina SM41 TaxID=1263870 RepID=M5U7B1_9BACT|nr:helix-turn-helix domain-containing protein [Rhodopirellula sallentina]EMI51838.1 transcriptional regulator, AraC family [Rhodopirellula sallentina SM41]
MIEKFLSGLDGAFTGEELFDQVSDIVYFIKNCRGEYLVVNQTLVRRCGVNDKTDIIGKTATEVLGTCLGNSFVLQDQTLLKTGIPLLSRLELHHYVDTHTGWCLTTKFPLRGKDGKVKGLVGISKDLRIPDLQAEEYSHVADAVRYAEQNVATPPSVAALAELAQMSTYQLNRRMHYVFGLTAGQWLTKLRIDFARQLLVNTDQSIAAISLEAGYADQSAFTRQFRHSTGLSPKEFRQINRDKLGQRV